ncbi:hypothetical protein BXZ70DRAFT_954039 [Cristinia sonorae]|uniref:DUF7918 domain-containing protein n=1 Tax=Cristinia sonorae TaxID=1940300 RepID=A0A8K0XLL0_9AGAR|nr:hypothetical protein BXZ70DRAFT_954039 [Cristinia sonorae]
MPKIGKFSAHIVVDGKEVEEYGLEESDENNITCFIPSATDQTFSINLTSDYHEDVGFNAYMDGPWVSGQMCRPRTNVCMLGVRQSGSLFRPFTFGALELTDDEDALMNKSAWSDLGCIELRVLRIVQGSHHVIPSTNNTTFISDGPVHERSKKSGSHRIKLGAPQHGVREVVSVAYRDTVQKPFARIRFLYRPKGLLQAQGIIPSSPKPESRKRRKEEPHEEKPSPAERRKKEERLKALRAEAESLEAELGMEGSPGRVKKESSPVRIRPSTGDNDIIDLTED